MNRIFIVFALLFLGAGLSAQTIVSSDTRISSAKIPRLRIALQGGPAYAIGKVDDSKGEDIERYEKNLQSGICFGAEFSYFFYESVGFGLKYNKFQSKESMSEIISDDIVISFIGPICTYTTVANGQKSVFSMNFGLGYVGYRDDCRVITPFSLSGGTGAVYFGLMYDYKISDSIAIGVEGALYGGSLSRVKSTVNGTTSTIELEKDQTMSVSHADLSIGLRFYL